MPELTPSAELLADQWWREKGRFIDPDTSDVPWDDMRGELAQMAYIEGFNLAHPPNGLWAALIRENAELKKFAAGLEMNLAAVIRRAEAAEAKLAELRAAVAAAPHTVSCDSNFMDPHPDKSWKSCDCWKSRLPK